MAVIRVLVVEDSMTVRRHLCDVIAQDPSLAVVGEAEDGQRAIELCEALRPDVITMDMMLPRVTGLEATTHIMAHRPTPILVVSSSTNRGEAFRTYEALTSGAVDVLEKPTGEEPAGEWEQRLHQAIKLVSRVRVVTHLRGRLRGALTLPPAAAEVARDRREVRVVAIGASTGGPGALLAVLRGLRAPFPLPVVIVLHLAEIFAASFAEWLDAQTDHRVAFATDGAPLAAGRVIMAPASRHLVVRGERLRIDGSPARHGCRPSVDVLFESVAREHGPAAVACLLTGMGRDGAAGLLAVRNAGGRTFAQDEATSVVYGMPREAVLLGAAERVLPLGGFAPALEAIARAQEVQ